MKVLFIGGNGNISWHCTSLALEMGHEVWALNRAATRTTRRELPPGVKEIIVDIRDRTATEQALRRHEFDVVADFICYTEEHAQTNIDLFADRTGQFIFVSSEAVYERGVVPQPFREDSPQYQADAVCGYIAGKIKAEELFLRAWENRGFPAAIVRPGYTYDTILPVSIGHNCFTAPRRALDGRPFLIAGDGKNLWPFTHSSDFAAAFVALLGDRRILGDAVQIIGDVTLCWNDAMKILAEVLHIRQPQFYHIPEEVVCASGFAAQKELFHSRMIDAVFDNSRIKRLVPGWSSRVSLASGLEQTIRWLYEDERRIRIVPEINIMLEKLEMEYEQKLSHLRL